MASLEQRPRGDGGITARVIWRQDGQRTAEKFAVGRNPLLAAKRFKTLVEEAGNRWPEGWVPTGTKRPSEDRMREVFRVASATGPHHGEVETLAFDLYSASFFQSSADTRLLMLMMGLEILLTLQPRSHDARQHVAELMQATKEANLPSDEARSLLGSLSWLEKESISQAGRRLVSRLEPRTYMELTPVKFFNKCYSLRSALAHGHVPRPDLVDVGVIAASLELMMAHLLSGHLLDAVPD